MIPVSKPYIDESDITSVKNQIESGWISSNANSINEFEKGIANYVGSEPSCGLAVSNGTSAIELALRSFKLNNKKKVLVPDITFAATINAVLAVGLEPLIIPVDNNFCYEDKVFEEVTNTNELSAIIFVHLYGIDCITKSQYKFISKNKEILTIADCAESFDAFKDGKHIGLNCDAFTFSFFANKIITTGEGGFVSFKNISIAKKAKLIRDHGMSSDHKYWHLEHGTNTRMAALQASLGISQLKKINFMIKERKNLLTYYINFLRTSKYFKIWKENQYLSIWFVNLTLKENIKDNNLLFNLAEYLKDKEIETRPCFHSLSNMPVYSKFAHSFLKNNQIKILNQPSKNIKLISLPTYVGLGKNEISEICSAILEFEVAK